MIDIHSSHRFRLGVGAIALATSLLQGATLARAQATFTHRLVSVELDYDNNGLVDATSTLTYDGAGRVINTDYLYVGDGVPDLFVTEDDDAASEAGVLGYDASNFVTSASLVRQRMGGGSESFETLWTYTSGLLTRADSMSTFSGSTSETYTTFGYTGSQLDDITERQTSDDSILYTQSYTYGGDDLPDLVSFDSPGSDSATTMNWRTDGQLDDLASTTTAMGLPPATGGADYLYDGAGKIQTEVWTQSGFTGSFFAEFQGTPYRKTYTYVNDLKTREDIDIGDDGSIEASRTYIWQPGACVPVLIFAPNGRPNFAKFDAFPLIPGTGGTWQENCGPYLVGGSPPQPVPALTPLLLPGLLAGLGALGFRQLRGGRSREGEAG